MLKYLYENLFLDRPIAFECLKIARITILFNLFLTSKFINIFKLKIKRKTHYMHQSSKTRKSCRKEIREEMD